ncbi:MAG: hypothetical protein NT092_14130, partial [Bacteroidia bacterium]|nr:hypothetical protein [Bacteroidia bacterium]
EWTILLHSVGGKDNAGDAIKETGLAHWRMMYNKATNTSGFSATGGGNRNMYGPFEEVRSRGYFWSASDYPDYVNYPTSVILFSDAGNVLSTSMDKKFGMSVRCIEDHYITDFDDNRYNTIKIGSQIWIAENLKTTHFNDGTSIPLVTENIEWNNLQTPGYCWCDSSSVFGDDYYSALRNVSGALYNWHAVNTGKLCPSGWHVPEDNDWKILTDYLGGEDVAGDKLKATVFWPRIADTEPTATNESGFSALPGGYRRSDGRYDEMDHSGEWWSFSEYQENSAFDALYRSMGYENSIVKNTFINKSSGLSVRCVKN